MNDRPTPICSTCGRPLRPNAPEHLCAACLMTAAMRPDNAFHESPETEPRALDVPPTEGLLVAVNDDDDAPVAEPTPDAPHEFGGYRLVKVLGKGGMGVVYEAEQMATGRRVALKMLGQQFNSSEVRRRFLREGRLAAGVSHPNSVYVFGTEEIDGLPVITMEVAGGGTLQDAIDRRGRLPVTEAIDAMLDIIDGLEAALSKDVLHRDIKPSNCFVDPDGRVKVGDFGLSVSTISSVDTFATATGVTLGTPAFASPEQLRGNELDHRSDIYAIGSTLFTLLAGHPPFKGNNAVQIVAAVLDEVPTTLDQIRDDVPIALARIVAKCLAKKPETRFADYTSLRAAFLSFSSRRLEPEPAPLVRRALAGMIDVSIAWTMPRTVLAASAGALYFEELWNMPRFWIYMGLSAAWYLGYFAASEGSSGASIGKRVLSLQVATRSGRAVGRKRALARALLSLASLQSFLVFLLLVSTGWIDLRWARSTHVLLFVGIGMGMLVLPALTMRRHNGLAMVWDKLTRTRVVILTTGAVRISVSDASETRDSHSTRQMIGPYERRRTICAGEWIEAVDPALDRLVWLRKRTADSLTTSRRDVARPTRLRWLQSVHNGDDTWDAMEAKAGFPLSALVANGGADWQGMRHWLYDLSLELASASQDATLPDELTLDHVWITRQGHAVLLDEPYPTAHPYPRIGVRDIAGQQTFLSLIAARTRQYTVPLQARNMLKNLACGAFDRLSFLAGNLRSLLTKPARIDGGSRATALLTVPLFLIATFVISQQASEQTYRAAAARWSTEHPGLPPLSDVLRNRRALAADVGDVSLRTHLAGHYQHLKEGLAFQVDGREIVATLGDNASQEFLRQLLISPPEFDSTRLVRADDTVAQSLDSIMMGQRRFRPLELFPICVGVLAFIAVVQLPAVLLFASTLGQVIFGFAVVDDRGAPAGRLRLLARWLIVWTPIALVLALAMLSPWAYLLLIPWLAGLVVAIQHPARGWQERWTGTWLVPR